MSNALLAVVSNALLAVVSNALLAVVTNTAVILPDYPDSTLNHP